MASEAMQARVAAAMSATLGDATEETPEVAEVVETGGATEGAATETVDPGEAEAQAIETPEQAEAKARATRLALFEEKLKGQREKREAQRLAERAKADRRAAQADREAAAKEKAEIAEGKKDFKKFFDANGMDSRAALAEMVRQASEENTPEAEARRAEEKRQADLDARLTPMQRELELLRAERAQFLEQQESTRLVTSFQRAVADPAFEALRIEYPDEALFDHAQHYVQNPDQLQAAAEQYGVRLTAPEKGFTMHELLQVLSAAQAAHDAGVQARRSARSPAEAQAGKPPTVNGTAERRNAGTAIGNDLASQRASARPEVSGSVKDRVRQRIEDEIRKGGG